MRKGAKLSKAERARRAKRRIEDAAERNWSRRVSRLESQLANTKESARIAQQSEAVLQERFDKLATWQAAEDILRIVARGNAGRAKRSEGYGDTGWVPFAIKDLGQWERAVERLLALGLVEASQAGTMDLVRLTETGRVACERLGLLGVCPLVEE